MLIKECIKTQGVYTTADFAKYIELHSNKDFTKSQISGALSQLVDTKDIVRIERGLYSRVENSVIRNYESKSEKKETIFYKGIMPSERI